MPDPSRRAKRRQGPSAQRPAGAQARQDRTAEGHSAWEQDLAAGRTCAQISGQL
jgi:hypothetical protein